MASPALRGDGDDEPHQQQPSRSRHPRRYAPYNTAHERWPTCVADAVDKALQRGPDGRQHEDQSAAPMMRRRRLLASKVELAARSAINMAAYIERRAVLMWSSSAATDALSGADGGACELEDADDAQDEEDDDEGGWTMCCICLEKNRPNDVRHPVEALQCGHVFHRDCITQWIRYKRCCPVDRLELADECS
ncbi:Fact complex subunit ssrp1 [Globisporangium polare]